MNTLNNGKISISVNKRGAELTSIKCEGREYLWQAEPEFWARHSPVLFPIVGSVWNGEYRSHGKTYKLGQHGFARDMDFQLKSQSEDEILFELNSTDETMQKYPYKFRLEIGYRLKGKSVEVTWKVTNTGNEKMTFQIGAHPAFYWPIFTNEEIEGGVKVQNERLAKDGERGFFAFQGLVGNEFITSIIKEKGCMDKSKTDIIPLNENGMLQLNLEAFNRDTYILENSQVNGVTLCDTDAKPYLTLRFDAPLVGLWSPPKKNAPFICIEPWYGRADFADYEGDYEDKIWSNKLEVGETFETSYTIEIC